ncbi:MAG: VOC family protein [Parasphingorhabdus sp.]|uniref:VOC family protein n=1 Tax=Parasphingorhabdus sp. TaxID=2709688 RepID=UPI0032984341
MSEPSASGHIVWHDLLTTNVSKARQFYSALLGWSYEVEHATEFVWKSGEADYPLILHDGEAHGGFIEIEPDQPSRWLAFVAVDDVDDAAARSKILGATIEREPFDIPGVGRSAVVRDAQGATICPFVASHDYPAPTGVFLWDERSRRIRTVRSYFMKSSSHGLPSSPMLEIWDLIPVSRQLMVAP